MHRLILEIDSNEKIWSMVDKSIDSILIENFIPVEKIDWWDADLNIIGKFDLKNITVRDMRFDLQTNLDGLKKIIALNTQSLKFYQFGKPIPGRLQPKYLPDNKKYSILNSVGLYHYYSISYEFFTINTFDEKFIRNIKDNEELYRKIIKG